MLALALVAPAPGRAQVGFPIPVPASVLVVPLLLLALPLGMELSKSDATRVRELEARRDWRGLAALATRRLDAQPGDLHWHALRGRALQQQGRCGDAIPDLRLAFEGQTALSPVQVESAFATGVTLGVCEMAGWDLTSAAQTLRRLATLDPGRWEPDYHLGVILALQGDLEGARAAQARLQVKNAAMAAALQSRYIDPGVASVPSADLAGPETPVTGAAAGALSDARLVIGNRTLVLPPGAWVLAATSQETVRGSSMRNAVSRTNDVTVLTHHAYAVERDRLSAVATFSANPKQAYGTSWWMADVPCKMPDAVVLERFNSPFDQPECLSVRVVDRATAAALAALEPALHAARAAGATLPAASYEVHYVRYGLDWVVASTWLLPMQRVAGDLAAVQWALALAEGLRPLGRQSGAQSVTVPPLGPMP
jgi:hypothetical protein